MSGPHGFDSTERQDGTVVITHHGRPAATLRGSRAAQFLREAAENPQLAMARWTGNSKRGNKRGARQHPRNR